jgi:hypothetical protein
LLFKIGPNKVFLSSTFVCHSQKLEPGLRRQYVKFKAFTKYTYQAFICE